MVRSSYGILELSLSLFGVESNELIPDSVVRGVAYPKSSRDNAPLEFEEEIARVHFGAGVGPNSRAGTIFSASASNRGSPCSGFRNGLTRMDMSQLERS